MKVLVVGASGFLGSAIARKFMDDSHTVWGTYVHGKENIPEGCTAVAFDEVKILDPDFDVVIVAAGNHALPPRELVGVNFNIPYQLMEQFPNTKLTFISSVSVYGNHDDVMTETSAFNNPSLYGMAKLAGEAIVQTHPKYAILRLTYLYGKDMPINSFVPAIINTAKTEKQITLFGKGERLQDYLHVEDAANLCLIASKHEENGTYLGATGHSISNANVAKAICQYVPDCNINFAGEDTAPWFQFDAAVTQKALSWRPTHEFETALKEVI